MQFDPLSYRYPSRRGVVYARNGMVCASQPLAAQAGLDMLKRGGNAIDAAIATAACMSVLEPTSNGIGGDAFSLIWTNGKLHGLNASGVCPALLNADLLRNAGHKQVPRRGWAPVMVPGAPAGWAALAERFGKLPLLDVLEPAARYAEEGYAVTPVISILWQRAYDEFSRYPGAEFKPFLETFAPDGRCVAAGEIWRSQAHADTLRSIGQSGARELYEGAIADKIDAFSRATGGFLRKADLKTYHADWVEPISTNYRGYDVWEIPPNGDGIVVLMALNLLEGFSFTERDTAETLHRQFESMKLAFTDGKRYVADPGCMRVTTKELLSKQYAAKRRALITDQALLPSPGDPTASGTVYLCAADGQGNMISYIQSNYLGFGSGVVVPGTGIALQNRGANFSLDPDAENCLAPGKKAFHTIIPGFLTKDGQAVGPFGVMGGFMQPQGQLQVVTNTIDFHMNPQEALDCPRWQWTREKTIQVEPGFPPALIAQLRAMGHEIEVANERIAFGRGQIIWRGENGVLIGATEPRADGVVAAW